MAKGIVYTIFGTSGSNITKPYVDDGTTASEWANIKSTEGYFLDSTHVATAALLNPAYYDGNGNIYGGTTIDTYNYNASAHNPLTQQWFDPGERAHNVLRVASPCITGEKLTITTNNGTDIYEIITNSTAQPITAGAIPIDLSSVCVKANQALTFTGNASDADTVTIGGKTYTLQATLTNTNGNVQLGATAGDTIQNLTDAINLTGTPGTQYALAMTKHPTVTAVKTSGTVLTATAINGGTAGNSIGTTKSSSACSWGNTTLLSGTDPSAANSTAGFLATINAGSRNGCSATQISANELVVYRTNPEVDTGACSETLAGSNNLWISANFFGGTAPGIRRLFYQARVPIAGEVTLTHMHFALPFAPTGIVQVWVIPTSTPGEPKAWDGTLTVNGNILTLTNSGGTNFATTDTVYLQATD